jgi:hypothetical protein
MKKQPFEPNPIAKPLTHASPFFLSTAMFFFFHTKKQERVVNTKAKGKCLLSYFCKAKHRTV